MKRLYKVTGVGSAVIFVDTVFLLVLATDAGEAERLALETWESWRWTYKPKRVELMAESRRNPPNGVLSLVGAEEKADPADIVKETH